MRECRDARGKEAVGTVRGDLGRERTHRRPRHRLWRPLARRPLVQPCSCRGGTPALPPPTPPERAVGGR